jgi:hypothetical protein
VRNCVDWPDSATASSKGVQPQYVQHDGHSCCATAPHPGPPACICQEAATSLPTLSSRRSLHLILCPAVPAWARMDTPPSAIHHPPSAIHHPPSSKMARPLAVLYLKENFSKNFSQKPFMAIWQGLWTRTVHPSNLKAKHLISVVTD